jgi:D-galactarate dehydratase / Altronate hydrolase, C terminus
LIFLLDAKTLISTLALSAFGRQRLERYVFHHRARLGVRLQADAVDQARHQSDIYRRMNDDMDIDCGDILDGVSVADKGEEIFQRVLKVASGERTKSEALGYGDLEFVPWQIGAVM